MIRSIWHAPQAVLPLLLLVTTPAQAVTLVVSDPSGQALATVMVRERRADGPNLDTSDDGYPAPGVTHVVAPEITRFSDAEGHVEFGHPSRTGN